MKKIILNPDLEVEYYLNGKVLFYTDGSKVEEDIYTLRSNYGVPEYDVLIIKNSVFFIYPNLEYVKPISCRQLFSNGSTDYFYTTNDGGKKGENIYVFTTSKELNPKVLGCSFLEITENVYKIGSRIYQFINGFLHEMCFCRNAEFEVFSDRLIFYAEEKDISEMCTFSKHGGRWEKTGEWLPGNIKPDSYFPGKFAYELQVESHKAPKRKITQKAL